ncbi:TolC family protein [uncultured Cetobacterium sp.]|uniref:TolC family protein n=1 Tax=uncultured Cetobacterium sp. TaxID=527638 RepID=UPI00260B8315|nr:TolC family protein [uncultured Cetobacterium sp.]
MRKILLLLLIINISVFSKMLNTAVILENNSKTSKTYLNILTNQLNENFAGTNFKINISKVLYLNKENINTKLKDINLDPKIDGIFILTDNTINEIKNLNKSKFYSMPFGFGKSSKILPKNLNYIYSDLDLRDTLSIFKEINGVKSVDLFVSNITSENLKKLSKKLKIEGLKINIYKTNLNKIKNIRNPSFIISFNPQLNKYAYAGIDMNREVSKRLKASSLNYMLFKTKNRLGEVVKVNEPRDDIFFNTNVATKIGYYPNLIFIQGISKINDVKKETTFLKLKDAINRALKSNLSLLKYKQDIKTNEYNVNIASSSRFPQLSANMDYNALDKRSPTFKLGSPENSTNSYLELSQVIFNDQLNASVKIQKLMLDSNRKIYEQQKLNTIYYVASTYVNILQLKAQLDIQKNNYSLLKETLGISKLNYKVGTGNLQDIYRLQSDVASSLSSITKIQGEIKNQEIYLNTLLNFPKDRSYQYESLKDISKYFFLNNTFNKNFTYGSQKTEKIENFLVKGALSNSNSLMALDNNIKAKERELSANGRERYLPKVSVVGRYSKDNIITPTGENSHKRFPDEYWQGGITLSLPLISGGEIYYKSKKIKSEISSLELNMENSQSDLSKEVLQTYTELLSNYVQSYSTEISATVAKKNLKIVKNLYSEGTITITDFLSAQNNALSQEFNNVIQNFNLINSALKLENLYGKSSLTMSSSEKEKILNELDQNLEN